MINPEKFIQMALSLPGTEKRAHHDRMGFGVNGNKMFATYWSKDQTANIFLTLAEQRLFCQLDSNVYPVPNKWGEKGATTFSLYHVPEPLVLEALIAAYRALIPQAYS